MTIPSWFALLSGFGYSFAGSCFGYWLGLRETKRRLKAHQAVTDRLMNAGFSASTGQRLTEHDDMINAAALSGMADPSYGGISRSSTAFTATEIRDQVKTLSGAAMQNPVTYSATPSKFASIAGNIGGSSPTAEQRSEFRKKLYEELKKAMDQDEIARPL